MKKKHKKIDVVIIANQDGVGYRAKIDAEGLAVIVQEIDALWAGKHKSLTLTRDRVLLTDWEKGHEFEGW